MREGDRPISSDNAGRPVGKVLPKTGPSEDTLSFGKIVAVVAPCGGFDRFTPGVCRPKTPILGPAL